LNELTIGEDRREIIMNDAENRRASHRSHPSQTKKILINTKQFILKDISREGIGVFVENSSEFFIGQRIASIFLEGHAKGRPLIGIVNHMSENDSGIVCGIRFDLKNNNEFEYVETMNRTIAAMQ
jgi:hypothetical protein